jgi:hypothetical protein
MDDLRTILLTSKRFKMAKKMQSETCDITLTFTL